jgi:hypothetical protein
MRDDTEDLAGRGLLLQCLSEGLLRLSELAGPPVELLLEIDRRGNVTTGSRRLLAVLGLRRPGVSSFHRYAALCIRPAHGHVTNTIDVTSGHPLMKPSLDAQDHARDRERYHTRADIERGLDRVQRAKAPSPILHRL